MTDRFGAPPLPTRRLLKVMQVRALGADVGAKRVVCGKSAVAVEFDSGQSLTRKSHDILSHQFGDRLDFAWHGDPMVTLRTAAETPEDILDSARLLLEALTEL